MIVKIYGKDYRIKDRFFLPAKNIILRALNKAKIESFERGLKGYYTSLVIQMYVKSALMLKTINAEMLGKVLEEIPEGGEGN